VPVEAARGRLKTRWATHLAKSAAPASSGSRRPPKSGSTNVKSVAQTQRRKGDGASEI